MLMKIFGDLKKHYAKKWQNEKGRALHKWWHVSGRFKPEELEIVIGAILTQNTNWRNVEKAIGKMITGGLTDAKSIAGCNTRKLQKIIRPAGFFTQKTERLKAISRFILDFNGDFYKDVTREQLLAIKGIGKETADSILLYACNKPEFVVDAYTKRIFSRYGVFGNGIKYDEAKKFFESRVKKDSKLYKELHALIVEHAKDTCRIKPLCEQCPLKACRRIAVGEISDS